MGTPKRSDFKSGLEYNIAKQLDSLGIAVEYETTKIKYQRKKKKKQTKYCVKCGAKIPDKKRSDSKYCSNRCKAAAEKKRYCDRHPDYVKRQRKLVREIRHLKEYGHIDYLDDPMKNPKDKYAAARVLGYRSMLEVAIADQLKSLGVDFEYETLKIPYQKKDRIYKADFVLPNGIIIEGKGRFKSEDRSKHLLIKEQHPELDIRFVFSNSSNKLNKNSKTTYASWCEKHGFLYADKVIPGEWLDD